MEIPKILENLNDYHQNAYEKNEILSFGEDLKALITESTNGRQAFCPDITANNMIKRLNNLLPKSSAKALNLFNMLAKYSNICKVYANIPPTLVRYEGKMYLLQTKKDTKIIQSKQCTEHEFFSLPSMGNDNYFPLFCYKISGKNPVTLFSEESALELWNSSFTAAIIQSYVQNNANPITIIRVLWRKGFKNKYYTITNRKKVVKKLHKQPSNSSNPTHRRGGLSKQSTDLISHQASISPTPEPDPDPFPLPVPLNRNNRRKHLTMCPFEWQEEAMHHDSLKSLFKNKETDGYSPITTRSIPHWQVESSEEFFVLTRNTESCYACKSSTRINEIEFMVDQIVDFLNSQAFQRNELKGIVIDFLKDKNNSWVLLDSREHCTDQNNEKLKEKKTLLRLETPKNSLNLPKIEVHQPRCESETRFLTPTAEENSRLEVEPETCPFKIRSKPRRFESSSLTERDFMERLNRINEKIHHPTELETPRNPFISGREEGISYYVKNFNNQNPSYRGTPVPNTSRIFSESRSYLHTDQLPIVDSQLVYIKKHFTEVIDHLEQMKTNVRAAKVKQQNIVKKYGGAEFWNKFIISLYKKVLACDILNKHFKDCKMESFEKIIIGMFKIIQGNINLDLRRRLRVAHYAKGISELEFNCYVDIFEDTIVDFNIIEEDRQGIMSQIRSMKSLICKSTL
ncbi:unnamed protein product [Blepharisma stoltei]|uniref:Uncharacterized protein n=1 Tax=Blepharisma stoltei TaxID=1481888 RepID=A0AAU9INR6_9CILI|nr:unnamed protein product [Blepharisma stoltei]